MSQPLSLPGPAAMDSVRWRAGAAKDPGAHALAIVRALFGPRIAVDLAQTRAPGGDAIVDDPKAAAARAARALPAAAVRALQVPGGVVELCAHPGAGALSLAFRLVALRLAVAPNRWACAVDPRAALCAPALAGLGIPLARLLVISPPPAAVYRPSVRALSSGAFVALIVDATSARSLHDAPIAVRRLTLAAERCGACVYLMTSPSARRALPLPCAVRAEVAPAPGGLQVEIRKHRRGLLSPLFVPAPDAELHVALSRCPDAPRSQVAGKAQRRPRPTRARGHRARSRAHGRG